MRTSNERLVQNSFLPYSYTPLEGGAVAVSAEQVGRREHAPDLEAAVAVDEERVALHVELLLEREPRVLEVAETGLALVLLQFQSADARLELVDLFDQPGMVCKEVSGVANWAHYPSIARALNFRVLSTFTF